MRTFLLVFLFALSQAVLAQKPEQGPDTTLLKMLRFVPEESQKKFVKEWKKMSKQEQEAMSFMTELPRSSKEHLIANIDSNYQNVWKLKTIYDELVADSLVIYIEFNPADSPLSPDPSIDIRISKITTSGNYTTVFQKWNVSLKSPSMDSILTLAGWDRAAFAKIKEALTKAHSISIKNGEASEIGFARSGMGKYFYVLFDKKLSPEDAISYNDGCTYIYYKENIVLKYGGGAIGAQCFPDE